MKFKLFFRRYVLRSLGIFLLFFLVNLVAMGVFIYSQLGSADAVGSAKLLDALEAGLSPAGFGDAARALLQDAGCGAFFIDDDTLAVRHAAFVTAPLPERLTASTLARMTRWYYQGHPAFVRTAQGGVIVLLCPKGSVWRYNAYYDVGLVRTMVATVALLYIGNIVLCVFLILRNSRRVEREVGPLLSGIDALSHGEFMELAPGGELAEVRAGLNRAICVLHSRDEARGRWIAGVSHDIRTPLSKVILQADLLAAAPVGEAERARARVILRQGERIRRLVSDLNAASSLEYDMQPLHPAPLYPTQVVRQAVTDLINDGPGDGYALTFDADEASEVLQMTGDAQLLYRAVLNLLYNSIGHNEDGCNIAVSVRTQENAYQVEVLDDGLGLGFSGRSPTPPDRFETHGIGLDLVRRVAQAHGGSLRLEEAAPHGCRAVLYFPLQS